MKNLDKQIMIFFERMKKRVTEEMGQKAITENEVQNFRFHWWGLKKLTENWKHSVFLGFQKSGFQIWVQNRNWKPEN